MSYQSFEQMIEEQTTAKMRHALDVVVQKWQQSPTPIWRAAETGFEPKSRHVTIVFRSAHERLQAAKDGSLVAIRNDLEQALTAQRDAALRINICAVTFTDLDADTTFLFL